MHRVRTFFAGEGSEGTPQRFIWEGSLLPNNLRSVDYSLQGTDILCLPKPSTTTYGQKLFSYTTAKYLPDKLRTPSAPNDFIRAIRQCKFNREVVFSCN